MFRRGWQDRQLGRLPFYYADPAIQLLTSLASRGTMIAMRRFSVSRFWDVVKNYDATEILSIASISALLMKGEPGPSEPDHRIRLAIHAGLPKELHAEMIRRFGFHWHNQYGSTEGGVMSRVPHHLADELVGSGTMGVEPPGVNIRIVDDEDKDVPLGQSGEALIGGPDLYVGYLNRPEVTAEANRGGWYHSGDVVRRDERGLLYFVGRKKEIIRRSGENISAAEVEAVLRSNPKVLEVAVVPVPDDLRGEEVKVYIQLNKGEFPKFWPPEAIVEFCKANLAAFKIPRFIEYRLTDLRTHALDARAQAIAAEGEARSARRLLGPRDRQSGGCMSTPASKGPQPCDILITDAYILTMDGKRTVYANGAIAISGTRIAAVGPAREIEAAWTSTRRISAGGNVVHPGFIDGHYHPNLHLSRGSITDDPNPPKEEGGAGPGVFTRWINALTDEDEYASTPDGERANS